MVGQWAVYHPGAGSDSWISGEAGTSGQTGVPAKTRAKCHQTAGAEVFNISVDA